MSNIFERRLVNKNLIFILGSNLFEVSSNKSSRTFLLHVCRHCNYSTYLVGHLKRHLLVHSGERPYACNVCNFRFNQKENLKRHLKLKHSVVIWFFFILFLCIWKKKKKKNLHTVLLFIYLAYGSFGVCLQTDYIQWSLWFLIISWV